MKNSGLSYGDVHAVDKQLHYGEVTENRSQAQRVLKGDQNATVGLEEGHVIIHDTADDMFYPYTAGDTLTATQSFAGVLSDSVDVRDRYVVLDDGVTKQAFDKPVTIFQGGKLVKSSIVELDAAAIAGLNGQVQAVQPDNCVGGEVFIFEATNKL